jgi:hypothetical protein
MQRNLSLATLPMPYPPLSPNPHFFLPLFLQLKTRIDELYKLRREENQTYKTERDAVRKKGFGMGVCLLGSQNPPSA